MMYFVNNDNATAAPATDSGNKARNNGMTCERMNAAYQRRKWVDILTIIATLLLIYTMLKKM